MAQVQAIELTIQGTVPGTIQDGEQDAVQDTVRCTVQGTIEGPVQGIVRCTIQGTVQGPAADQPQDPPGPPQGCGGCWNIDILGCMKEKEEENKETVESRQHCIEILDDLFTMGAGLIEIAAAALKIQDRKDGDCKDTSCRLAAVGLALAICAFCAAGCLLALELYNKNSNNFRKNTKIVKAVLTFFALLFLLLATELKEEDIIGSLEGCQNKCTEIYMDNEQPTCSFFLQIILIDIH